MKELDAGPPAALFNASLAVGFAVMLGVLFLVAALLLRTLTGEEDTEDVVQAMVMTENSTALTFPTQVLQQAVLHSKPTSPVFMGVLGAVMGALYGGFIADV